jgi:hypothetical protein
VLVVSLFSEASPASQNRPLATAQDLGCGGDLRSAETGEQLVTDPGQADLTGSGLLTACRRSLRRAVKRSKGLGEATLTSFCRRKSAGRGQGAYVLSQRRARIVSITWVGATSRR